MYDSHIFCEEYDDLKELVENLVNEEDSDVDANELASQIQELYEDGKMSAEQYDELMGYLEDLLG